MSNKPMHAGNIFISSILTTLKHAGKVIIISLAFGLKISGMFLLKFGEVVEKIIVKSHR
jgi:hypothetical protein